MRSINFLAVAALVSCASLAVAADDGKAAAMAAAFMAQPFDTDPATVHVSMVSSSRNAAIVDAAYNERVCRLEMSKAPEGVDVPYGWLIGSISCNGAQSSLR